MAPFQLSEAKVPLEKPVLQSMASLITTQRDELKSSRDADWWKAESKDLVDREVGNSFEKI